ncbi:MAG: hypothetical protein PHH85_01605 [Candidatus Methanoperedens sp.]|nr:hypothetical protein [Candidatus Methanoperedens sp.]
MLSEEVSLDKLLAVAGDKNVGENANNILEMLKETNKVLGEFQKTVNFLRSTGILPGIVRAVGKKYDIDMETPLKQDMAVPAPSHNHKSVMENISKMTEEQLLAWIKGMQENGSKDTTLGKP